MFDSIFYYFDPPHKVLALNFTPAIYTTPWVCKTIFPSQFRINRNRKRRAHKMPSEDRFLKDMFTANRCLCTTRSVTNAQDEIVTTSVGLRKSHSPDHLNRLKYLKKKCLRTQFFYNSYNSKHTHSIHHTIILT